MSKKFTSIQPPIRIDKWLWAVRLCKTRAIATDLCKRQKVFINNQIAKPSREIHSGQTIILKREGIQWKYKIIQCIDKRVSAPLAAGCKEDITPKESLARLKMVKDTWTPRRPKGSGRPTKKERRDLDNAKNKILTQKPNY